MRVNDITKMFERIKKHYNTFGYDDTKVQEWHRFLKDYSNESIARNLDKYILEAYDRPPIVGELLRGAEKEFNDEIKPVYIQCDICKEKILMTDDWSEFNRHYRRCQMKDFIRRQEGVGIVEDDELEERYNKAMAKWKASHNEICLKQLFQRI